MGSKIYNLIGAILAIPTDEQLRANVLGLEAEPVTTALSLETQAYVPSDGEMALIGFVRGEKCFKNRPEAIKAIEDYILRKVPKLIGISGSELNCLKIAARGRGVSLDRDGYKV